MSDRAILFNIGRREIVLGKLESGWTRELNIVRWNGGPYKVDIRDWSPDHCRMTRGITLSETEAQELKKILSENLPAESDFPTERSDDPGEAGANVSFKILMHLGTIKTLPSSWVKEVNIVSWNGGEPKVDIRDWCTDYSRMSRGIRLSRDEAMILATADMSCVITPPAETSVADEIISMLIDHFLGIPGIVLAKTESGEIRVTSESGVDTLSLKMHGKPVEISVKAISEATADMDCCSMQPS